MKKSISIIAAVMAFAGIASANSQVYTFNVTNSVAQTNSVSLSGWLDKIEVSSPNVSAGSYAVVVASYDDAMGAIDTYCTLSGKTTSATVVRPRVLGTLNTGASLSGTTNITSGIMSAAYGRPLIGGNTKIICTPTSASSGGTVKVEIYYSTDKTPIAP
jgi:hypothetical protein